MATISPYYPSAVAPDLQADSSLDDGFSCMSVGGLTVRVSNVSEERKQELKILEASKIEAMNAMDPIKQVLGHLQDRNEPGQLEHVQSSLNCLTNSSETRSRETYANIVKMDLNRFLGDDQLYLGIRGDVSRAMSRLVSARYTDTENQTVVNMLPRLAANDHFPRWGEDTLASSISYPPRGTPGAYGETTAASVAPARDGTQVSPHRRQARPRAVEGFLSVEDVFLKAISRWPLATPNKTDQKVSHSRQAKKMKVRSAGLKDYNGGSGCDGSSRQTRGLGTVRRAKGSGTKPSANLTGHGVENAADE